jgi:two-component system chemotaxis response regulator CheB
MGMRRFLVVEDSATVRLVIKSAIRKVDPSALVDEAEDAKSAMTMFRPDAHEVVFLDLVLAGGTKGLVALDAILDKKPDARVVLVTGLPMDSIQVVSAISRGAAGVIQKPVRAEAVREILSTLELETGTIAQLS